MNLSVRNDTAPQVDRLADSEFVELENAALPPVSSHMEKIGAAVAGCFAALFGAVSASCTTIRAPSNPREPLPLTEELKERFSIQLIEGVELKPPKSYASYEKHRGKITIEGEQLKFEYYLPKDDIAEHPFVLVIPILGGGEGITDLICRWYARRGTAAGTLDRNWSVFRDHETVPQLEENFVQCVREQRAFLNWVADRPGIDGERLEVFGVSLGGMFGALLGAVEPRIDCEILCICGGDLETLVFKTEEERASKWVTERLEKDGITAAELRRQIAELVSSDPVELAKYIDTDKVMFVTARFDGVVPRHNSDVLWKAMGKPERKMVPTGHYTAILALPYILSEASQFAEQRFAIEVGEQGPISGKP